PPRPKQQWSRPFGPAPRHYPADSSLLPAPPLHWDRVQPTPALAPETETAQPSPAAHAHAFEAYEAPISPQASLHIPSGRRLVAALPRRSHQRHRGDSLLSAAADGRAGRADPPESRPPLLALRSLPAYR